MHCAAELMPGVGDQVPLGQGWQAEAEVALGVPDHVPAGQALQKNERGADQKPSEQHTAAPVVA